MANSSDSKLEQFKLDPVSGRELAVASEGFGALRLLQRLWPLWPRFARGPWRAYCFAQDVALRGREVDLLDLLAMGPAPSPKRPNLGMRWAVGQMLGLAGLERIDPGLPIGLRAASEVYRNIDAPQFARRATLSSLESGAAEPQPGAAVWSQSQRWAQAPLAPLAVAGLALASWEREGPDGQHRSAAGRVLLMGLAHRLGLPAEGFTALAEGLVEATENQYDLAQIAKRVRKGKGWRWWLSTFFAATAISASKALEAGLSVRALHLDHRELIHTWVRAPRHPLAMLELLVARPVVDLPTVSAELGVTQRTAGLLAHKLANLGLIEEITGQKRGRRYAYTQLIEILVGYELSHEPEEA